MIRPYMLLTALAFMVVALPLALQGATHTFINAGFTFSPSVITVNQDDTVLFSIADIHNAVEVSQAAWNANDITPNGGFAVPFGGGSVGFATPDTLYYICQAHASMGMKGIIIVAPPVGTGGVSLPQPGVVAAEAVLSIDAAYPNPAVAAQGALTVRVSASESGQAQVDVHDALGRVVRSVFSGELRSGLPLHLPVDIAKLPAGTYAVRLHRGSYAVQRMVSVRN